MSFLRSELQSCVRYMFSVIPSGVEESRCETQSSVRGILRLRCAPLRMTSWIALASAQAADRAAQALVGPSPYSLFSLVAIRLRTKALSAHPTLRRPGTGGRLLLA